MANATDFPYTITPNTKLAELQILKPEETILVRPVDSPDRPRRCSNVRQCPYEILMQ